MSYTCCHFTIATCRPVNIAFNQRAIRAIITLGVLFLLGKLWYYLTFEEAKQSRRQSFVKILFLLRLQFDRPTFIRIKVPLRNPWRCRGCRSPKLDPNSDKRGHLFPCSRRRSRLPLAQVNQQPIIDRSTTG
jgi:hypothetical protein